MTVEVQTPSGIRSGSSVVQVQPRDNGKGFPGPEAGGIRQDIHAEAVAVGLPGNRTLFALLTPPGDDSYAANLMGNLNQGLLERSSGDYRAYLRELKKKTGPISVPRLGTSVSGRPLNLWPLFVMFKDEHDPASVFQVNPEDSEALLGPGTKISRLVVELTDERPSKGIEKRLPWIFGYKDRYLDGQRYNNSQLFANQLTSHNFSSELGR